MKRRIGVKSECVTIEALVHANAKDAKLTASEVQEIADTLATRLMHAASELPYVHTPLSRVKVILGA